MKHIYLNLKRFDVPAELGGVNRIADVREWGSYKGVGDCCHGGGEFFQTLE